MSSTNTQPGTTPQLELREGERFLFIRIGEDGAFQVLFSDPLSALGLNKMAARWMELNLLDPSLAPQSQQKPAIQIPQGLDIAGIQRRMAATTGRKP